MSNDHCRALKCKQKNSYDGQTKTLIFNLTYINRFKSSSSGSSCFSTKENNRIDPPKNEICFRTMCVETICTKHFLQFENRQQKNRTHIVVSCTLLALRSYSFHIQNLMRRLILITVFFFLIHCVYNYHFSRSTVTVQLYIVLYLHLNFCNRPCRSGIDRNRQGIEQFTHAITKAHVLKYVRVCVCLGVCK